MEECKRIIQNKLKTLKESVNIVIKIKQKSLKEADNVEKIKLKSFKESDKVVAKIKWIKRA